MGQGESTLAAELPFESQLNYELHDLDEDAVVGAGFAATPEQAEKNAQAAADAAASAAALNLDPLMMGGAPAAAEPVSKTFSVSAIERRISDYRLQPTVLGEGGFGTVKLAKSQKTGHTVAVKIIKRKKLNERSETMLQREVKHHERLKHANIVRLFTWIKTPMRYFLVMECCDKGDMLHYLNKKRQLHSEEVRWFFKQLLDGLAFCHGIGMYHRDLKLENLLLVSRTEPGSGPDWEELELKIADFGLSDLVGAGVGAEGLSSTYCGSPLYAAPELFSGDRTEGYDASKSDMWSCGVVLYALLSSSLPFDADDMQALVRMVCKGKVAKPLPEARGKEAAALVKSLLSVDPNSRPSAREAAAAPWMTPELPLLASVKTTPELPQLEDLNLTSSSSRKTVSGTAAFFKDMLARENHSRASAPSDDEAGGRRQPGSLLTKAELLAIRAEAAAESIAEDASPQD
ncbi:hypothetical protein AB1Y20_002579 [Prymnesium parvum]|uniref:Protein kinase domain-containing protein n=1 Tax=Prymnesium parvum TaxID=97485 RepID=A0AB34J9Q1_PRYPA|mmetsp:Transcript_25208/g.62466  ORF Transcript_25208/g.62466 Transcript_25208/m.62466 type:complete len:460 (+) Transcript_25208:13-1392(+)